MGVLIIALYFLFCIIITAIITAFCMADSMKKPHEKIKEAFDNTIIKDIDGDITREKIIEKLGLFDKNIYNDLFDEKIRQRGEMYYYEGKVKRLIKDGNKYSCKLQESMLYRISIEFENDDPNKIKEMKCNCPYNKEDNLNCKHLYSLLYKIKCDGNRYKMLQEIDRIIVAIKNSTNIVNEYIKNHSNKLESKTISEVNQKVIEFYAEFNKLTKLVKESKLEDQTLGILLILIKITKAYKDNLIYLMNKKNQKNQNNNINEDIEFNSNNINSSDESEDFDDKDSEDEEKPKKSFLEIVEEEKKKSINKGNKKRKSGLEKWQEDLVDKGEYKPWDFEEDERDDDNFYSDDDD